MRKLARVVGFILLSCLLAEYMRYLLGEGSEGILVRTWTFTFQRLDAVCFSWIMLRIAGWIGVYLTLLSLGEGFAIYQMLRQRSFLAVSVWMYLKCLSIAFLYLVLSTAVMAVYHRAMWGMGIGELLGQGGLAAALAGECLGCLTFCLAAFLVYWCCGRAEIGFLAALGGRIAAGYIMGSREAGLPVRLGVNLLLTAAVFWFVSRNFAERNAS